MGNGLDVVAKVCETNPVIDSAQLWQNHRVADRTVNGRDYYFQFNRSTNRVLTAQPGLVDGLLDAGARVVSAPAQPISKSGSTDLQLWLTLGL